MRKILITYSPASMLLVFLGMVLITLGGCGGGGGGGEIIGEETQPAPPAPPSPGITLTGFSINGPSSMNEYGTATYTATASWSDDSTSTVTPDWSVNTQMASISPGGELSCHGIDNNQMVTITAEYSSGGTTETATMDVTITCAPSTYIPFTDEELSGKAFFDGVGLLYKLNADSSLEMYFHVHGSPGDRGYYRTGTWSNDPDSLFLDFRLADAGPYTVYRFADSSTDMEVEIYEPFWGAHVKTWEKTIPVEPVKLPGTYTDDVDGSTWVFNANGTGTISAFGGITFTWSVDSDGVLRMPSGTGHTAVFYARATSQSTATVYTILKVGFVELYTQTGGFYKYYGGCELTRQ